MAYDIARDCYFSHTQMDWEITASLRRVAILLALDRSGLKDLLSRERSILIPTADGTSARVLKAGAVLGLFRCNEDGSYSWNSDYEWIRTDSERWKQLIAILRHQVSYMNLIETPEFWIKDLFLPVTQIATDPRSYETFLLGVASSHRKHALWLSQLDELRGCRSMADLGGGLGTYAEAWVTSNQNREAIIVDFPGVAQFVGDLLKRNKDRLGFMGADLNEPFTLPSVDFILFANVLHLIPDWPQLLHRTMTTAREGSIIAIFEADPNTPHGALFDLQVHLRSGRLTGLLETNAVDRALAKLGLNDARRIETIDHDDPFQRQYNLWLAEVKTPYR